MRDPSLETCFSTTSTVLVAKHVEAAAYPYQSIFSTSEAGVFEIIAFVFVILLMDRVGRRMLLTITLTGAGVALLASTVVNEYAEGAPSKLKI